MGEHHYRRFVEMEVCGKWMFVDSAGKRVNKREVL